MGAAGAKVGTSTGADCLVIALATRTLAARVAAIAAISHTPATGVVTIGLRTT